MDELIRFDDRLRMVPADESALRVAVEGLREQLERSPDQLTRRRLGVSLMALGELKEAIALLEDAVREAVDAGSEAAARINLGDALRYRGDLDAALAEYLGALDLARSSVPQLVDFALQHLGKHYVDAGRATDAIACLEEALELRRGKGDQALVESTLAVLRLCGRDTPGS